MNRDLETQFDEDTFITTEDDVERIEKMRREIQGEDEEGFAAADWKGRSGNIAPLAVRFANGLSKEVGFKNQFRRSSPTKKKHKRKKK